MTARIIGPIKVGDAAYGRHLLPIMFNPPRVIFEDSEIDMRRRKIERPDKLWWIAVSAAGELLAQCAVWPSNNPAYDLECGHNYEHGHRRRAGRVWPRLFDARQEWLIAQGRTAVTYIFDQPLPFHLTAGWTLTGKHDISGHGHHWQELTWRP